MRTKLVLKPEDLRIAPLVPPPEGLPSQGAASPQQSTVQTVLQSTPNLDTMTSAQKVASGLVSVATGLGEAAKKAAFSVGFGTLGLGAGLLLGEQFGKAGSTAISLLAVGAFFVCAALGKLLDRRWGLP